MVCIYGDWGAGQIWAAGYCKLVYCGLGLPCTRKYVYLCVLIAYTTNIGRKYYVYIRVGIYMGYIYTFYEAGQNFWLMSKMGYMCTLYSQLYSNICKINTGVHIYVHFIAYICSI